MKLYNSTQNSEICHDIKVAENFFSRTVGLISKKSLDEGEGLIINPCCSIHTFFMRFAIDVLFIGENNKIIALYENVKPWRILPIHPGSYYVVELPAYTISKKNIKKSDLLMVNGEQ